MTGDDRTGGQAQPESTVLGRDSPHDRPRTVGRGGVTTKDFIARMAEILGKGCES